MKVLFIVLFAVLAVAISAQRITECPAVDGDYAVTIPHETDSTKFYLCNAGTPIEQQCPDGLEYSSWTGICDWAK